VIQDKFSKGTALAVLVSGLVAAGQASAFGPSVVPTAVVYLGGGAEQADSVGRVLRSLLVNDSTLDEYTEQTDGSPGAAHRYYFGTLAANAGPLNAGDKILLKYRSSGGVFANGIGPVARGGNINYLNIAGATQDSTTLRWKLITASNNDPQSPDVGFSNTEIGVYIAPNLPAGNLPLSAAEKLQINVTPIYSLVGGIAVTQALYDGTDVDGVGLNTSANSARAKKSFSRYEITSILNGTVTDWSQVTDDAGNALPAGPVVLYDRNNGSGAKAVSNAYFLNNPGGGAFQATLPPIGGASNQGSLATSPPVYVLETVSSAVLQPFRLQAAQNANRRAIAVLGRQSLPAAPNLNWRFVAIDGVDLGGNTFSRANVINGRYDYWYTANIVTRNQVVNGKRAENDATVGALITAIKNAALDATITTQEEGVVLDPNVPQYNPATTAAGNLPFIVKGTRKGGTFVPVTRF